MRRFNLLVIFLVSPIMVFGQLKIQSNGVFNMNNVLAGSTEVSGSPYNVSFGYKALSASSLTGMYNTAVGVYALPGNTTGSSNTALGSFTLNLNTTGVCNTAIGDHVLAWSFDGSYNTATYIVKVTGGGQVETKQLVMN